jgi:hypothetical protein
MVHFDEGDTLLVPIYNEKNKLVNLQFIHEDGHKHFLKGGQMQGCHYWVTKPKVAEVNNTIVVGEGWATGEVAYQATACAVISAFCASNLVAVAKWVRGRYPEHIIIIAADDDWKTPGNPGVSYAKEAARAVGGLVAIPKFDGDRGDKDTDFNDMLAASSPKAVRRALADAVDPADMSSDMNDNDKYEARIAALSALESRAYDAERVAIKEEFGARVTTIDRDVEKYRTKVKFEQAAPPARDIKELAESAKDIIACEDVLTLFAEDCSRVIAGEKALTKLTLLSGTSRLFRKAMHIALKGPSSAGKSEVRRRVLNYFPPEAVFTFTALSDKALIYEKDDFQHKILSMGEALTGKEAEFLNYLLRELMSENVLRYPVVQKQPDGTMETITIEKHGPVAFMVTTTHNQLHQENETRMLSIEVDDSAKQTRKVIEMVAEVEGLNRDVSSEALTAWHDYQRWLAAGERRVWVPFAPVLARLIKETGAVRLRRDFAQLLLGIKAHALLHRQHRRRTKQGSIVATIEQDYAQVRALLADLLASASELKTRKAIKETVAVVKELESEHGERFKELYSKHDGGVSVRQVGDVLHLDRSTAGRRLRKAVDDGYLINVEHRPGRAARYQATEESPTEGCTLLPKPKAVRAEFDRASYIPSEPLKNAAHRAHPKVSL